jgi:hypothetical protein
MDNSPESLFVVPLLAEQRLLRATKSAREWRKFRCSCSATSKPGATKKTRGNATSFVAPSIPPYGGREFGTTKLSPPPGGPAAAVKGQWPRMSHHGDRTISGDDPPSFFVGKPSFFVGKPAGRHRALSGEGGTMSGRATVPTVRGGRAIARTVGGAGTLEYSAKPTYLSAIRRASPSRDTTALWLWFSLG